MSKHNNNLGNSSKARCSCGRYMSLGEDAAGVWHIGYKCPDCKHREYTGLMPSEEWYRQFYSFFQPQTSNSNYGP